MENNKQTAVEWLIEKINMFCMFTDGIPDEWSEALEQAKEMEKQQIVELKFQTLIAYGVPLEKAIMFSEQYYNKEYGNET